MSAVGPEKGEREAAFELQCVNLPRVSSVIPCTFELRLHSAVFRICMVKKKAEVEGRKEG